jgi:hypothetical protein
LLGFIFKNLNFFSRCGIKGPPPPPSKIIFFWSLWVFVTILNSFKKKNVLKRHAIQTHAKTMDNAQATTMTATCAHVKRDTREKTAKHVIIKSEIKLGMLRTGFNIKKENFIS